MPEQFFPRVKGECLIPIDKGIKTLIDLRASSEIGRQSPLQKGFNVVHIPLATGDMRQKELALRISTLEACDPDKLFCDEIQALVQEAISEWPPTRLICRISLR